MSVSTTERTDRPAAERGDGHARRDHDARAPGIRELALATAGLLMLAIAVYGRHVIHGGFLLDDWSNYGMVELNGTGLWGDIQALTKVPRPLGGLYYAVFENVFGQHMGWWLAWIEILAVSVSAALYWLLRLLGMRRSDAFAIGVLVLVFHGADTLRLWAVGGSQQLTIAATLVGFCLALVAFRRSGRTAALALHAVSLALFAASLLFVEMTAGLMLLSIVVYRLGAVPWRPALARWAADVVVIGALAATATDGGGQMARDDTSGMWGHAWTIVEQAWTFFHTIVVPLGDDTPWWLVVVPVVLVVAVATVAYVRTAPTDDRRPVLGRWLVTVPAGVTVVALSYAVYVPATDWYVPLQPGVGNRVNGVAAIGWIVLVYATLQLLAALVVRRGLVRYAAPVLAVLLAAGYIDRTLADAKRYQDGFTLGRAALLTMRAALPDPPQGAVVYATGQPIEMAPGIPVFHATWDLLYAAKVVWRDPSVRALPAFPWLRFSCEAHEVEPVFDAWGSGKAFRAPYGRVFLVNTTTGELRAIDSQKACQQADADWPRSPHMAPETEG